MEESRLVKVEVEKLIGHGGIEWWEEYEVLRRKFELDNEGWSVGKLKNMINSPNPEVYMKSTLKWYRLAKDDTRVERFVRSVQGQKSEAVQAEDWFNWVVEG